MRETDVSQTALMTAFMRAAHQVFDGERPLLPDPIAIRLLKPEGRQRLEQMSDPVQYCTGTGSSQLHCPEVQICRGPT